MMKRKGINGRNGNGEGVRGINRGIEENNSESEMEVRNEKFEEKVQK